MSAHLKLRTTETDWHRAQAFELECQNNIMSGGDDYNQWWATQFYGYAVLHGRAFKNVLEVGCGPHTNARYILPLIKCEHLYLEDPLICSYVAHNFHRFAKRNQLSKYLSGMRVDMSASMLEELPFKDATMNLVICINVLDHCEDYDKCMSEMQRVLAPGGLLVMGQDLSNKDDLLHCPESYTDIGHPIKVDEETLLSSLIGYKPIFYKVLSREDGRNPAAHYGTMLGVFEYLR